MIAITDIDTSKLNSRILELHDALIAQGGDVESIFRDEARLFLRQVIRLTPPKTREQGEAAIKRDLMKIFTPVNQDFLDDLIIEHGHNNIDAWITSAVDPGVKRHVMFDYASNTGTEMADFHQRNRDNRGRTRPLKRMASGWYSPFAVSFEDFASYRDKVLKRVGMRKAGWGVSLIGMAGKVAGWIRRHVDSKQAKGELHLVAADKPSVTMINRSPGIGQDVRTVNSALRVRSQAIGRRIRLILSGYSEDVARGIKIQRRAHASPESMAEAA